MTVKERKSEKKQSYGLFFLINGEWRQVDYDYFPSRRQAVKKFKKKGQILPDVVWKVRRI